MMKQEQNQNNAQGKENTTRWVFIPVAKENVLKREETYALLKIGANATAIISSKFVRAKESETHIFLSIPEDYKIKVRLSKVNQKTHRYEVAKEKEVDAWYVRKCINKLQDVEEKDLPDDDLPF